MCDSTNYTINNYIIDVYHKSKYIPTITNFTSILANCFYFLQKIAALRPSVLNLWGRLVKFCQTIKNGSVGCGLWRTVLKILCSAHISSVAWYCHRLDLDTCVRRLVTKNGEFEVNKQIFDAKELMWRPNPNGKKVTSISRYRIYGEYACG